MLENQELEQKSLQVITGSSPNWSGLAKECICFANANGGKINIGIEDKSNLPPKHQKIPDRLIENINKKIPQLAINLGITTRRVVAENGGEYIFRNAQTIASTTNGKYYIRISDECRPLLPDELSRLMMDKNAYVWEIQTTGKISRNNYNKEKLENFICHVHESDRVSKFVKDKCKDELIDYYLFAKDDYLTNLGILWIGNRQDRASLLYSPVIQFIKYDENDRKIRKVVWDDFSLNPLELIESVLERIPEWDESIEISDGVFRRSIRNYDKVVIRELIANALVHKPYTTRGDIFINLYPDRLEVHNTGLLPLGVTPNNILHKTVKRNEHLAKVFYDLKLMEREGSGYDMMYEVLLSNGKKIPVVKEGEDRVTVTINKRIVNEEVIRFINDLNKHFQLRQKEIISLGLIAQYNTLSAIEFSNILGLKDQNSIRNWLGRIVDLKIIQKKGKTKGTEYYVNSRFLRDFKYKGLTTLKKIEPYRLKELILEDLKIYKKSGISEIQHRIGKEISLRKIRDQLNILLDQGLIKREGVLKYTKYLYNEKV